MKKGFIFFIFLSILFFPSLNALTCNSGDLTTICYITSAQSFIDTENFNGTGDLVISAAISNTTAMKSLILNFSNIIINGSGSITGGNITIFANNLTIASGRTISGSGLGYGVAAGPGAGCSGTFVSGGGGHGNYGGRSDTVTYTSCGGNYYDSIFVPNNFGSGAGSCTGGECPANSGGSLGGGIVSIIVRSLVNNGSITVNGSNGASSSRSWGGGAGGSIYVSTYNLEGNGSFIAKGGNGGSGTGGSGGGSGGIIAVWYNISTYNGFASSSVSGGSRGESTAINGLAGSMIFLDSNRNADIVSGFRFTSDDINTSFYNSSSPNIWNFNNLNLNNANITQLISVNLFYNNFTTNNFNWGCSGGGSSRTTTGDLWTLPYYGHYLSLNITGVNFTFPSGSSINLDGCGYYSLGSANKGTGAGSNGPYYSGGAGHGAAGGNSGSQFGTVNGGSAYGNYRWPITIGSAAGNSTNSDGLIPGGFGGGAIFFNIQNTLNLSGNIYSRGTNGIGVVRPTGGGSGGSILINTTNFFGSGNLYVNGGSAGWNSGGGSGGRIAAYSNSFFWTGTTSLLGGATSGGTGAQNGGDGTIFSNLATYNFTGGYDGSGAYMFDGMGDYIESRLSSALTTYTISVWIKNLTATSWSHVVWASDGVNYTNGVVSNPSQKPVYISSTTVQIGKTGSATYFAGSIDDVKIIPRILSSNEVLNLYNGTRNNSNYIGKYANQGDFKSSVFYNSTSSYWNLTLSTADTYSTRTGIVNNKNEINLSHPNLVSYWALDNNFRDATGRNNGTCTGTSCPNNATGISSNAMRFDGNDDYVSLPSNSLTIPYTISVWAKGGASQNTKVLIGFSWSNYARTYIGTTVGGYIQVETGDPSNDASRNQYITDSSHSFADNNWHLATITVNSSRALTVYYDGYNISTISTMTTYSGNTWQNGAISEGWGGSTSPAKFFNGTIDEVLIYNTSLSASDVQKLYKSGLSQHANTNITLQTRTANSYNVSDPSLIGLWDFNDLNSTIILDDNTAINVGFSNYNGNYFGGTIKQKGCVAGGTNRVAYNFTSPKTGQLDVFANTIWGSYTTTNFEYKIQTADGLIARYISVVSSPTGGNLDFMYLGTYNFTAGQTYWINATDNCTGNYATPDAVLIAEPIYDKTNKFRCYNHMVRTANSSSGIVGAGIVGQDGEWTVYPEYVNCNATVNYSNRTFAAWYKIGNIAGSVYYGIMADTNYGGGSNNQGGSIMYWQTSSTYPNKFVYYFYNGASSYAVQSLSAYTSGWHHVAATQNASGSHLYVDGVYQASSANSPAISPSNLTIGRIGSTGGVSNYGFNGNIDEVRVYNRSLSASEIQDLYNLGSYHINWNNNGAFSSEQTCYDNETQIMTEEGWKFFSELDKTERVATLNPETKKIEYKLPSEYQEYDAPEFMYRIKTSQGELIVSPEHKVYASIENKWSKGKIISFVVGIVLVTIGLFGLLLGRKRREVNEWQEKEGNYKN